MIESKERCHVDVNINDLPYDILLKIFSYLSVEDRVLDACLVCKLWHSVSIDGIFWNVLNFEDRMKISDEILLRSVGYSSNITTLNLLDCYSKDVTTQGLIEATRHCSKLKSLNLKNSLDSHIEDDTLIEICKNCPKLEFLNIDSQGISDEAAINGIAKYLKNLKTLNIKQNIKVTDDGLIAIVNNCPQLEELRVGLLRDATDKFMKVLAKREKKTPLMKDLCLTINGVTGKGTQYLQYFKNLIYLDITKCKKLDFDDVWLIVTNTRKLRRFFCGMQDLYDDRCVEITVKNLPDLREIYLGSTAITDAGMGCIADHSKNLEWLNVSYTVVTEKGIEEVCEKLPNLKHLGLTRIDKANEEAVEKIVLRFPQIHFSTFLQETKRMLIRYGQWFEEEPEGPLTQKMMMKCISVTKPSIRTKPRRLIGTGGKIEYIPYELPHMSTSESKDTKKSESEERESEEPKEGETEEPKEDDTEVRCCIQ